MSHKEMMNALLILGLVLVVISALAVIPWVNRNAWPVTWGGTAVVCSQGSPAEMPGIEIGFRHDGVVIWRQKQ
jgi:hypothetical protein